MVTLGWAPSMPLKKGLDITYTWIREQVVKSSIMQGCKHAYITLSNNNDYFAFIIFISDSHL